MYIDSEFPELLVLMFRNLKYGCSTRIHLNVELGKTQFEDLDA